MCGFVGMIDYDRNVKLHNPFIDFALNDLKRRGPDKQSSWTCDNEYITLGFARLAIRDLSENGNQPMHSLLDRYCIVYNGETYNTDELLSWASIDKKILKGHADTEVIVNCIEKKGFKETIQRMDGIFAIALYDKQEGILYLARDHAGIKPLYMGINSKGVVFSSHYQHITSHQFFRDEPINNNGLANYFKYGFIQEGEGLLENTFNVPHAHIITIKKDGSWNQAPYFIYNKNNTSSKNSTSELIEKYTEIVRSQLISDVPVGTFLSGGVDSTLTTGIVSGMKKDITAYTIGVDDKELDETNESKRFASYFPIHHIVKQINEKDIIESLDQYDESMGEPLGDFSSLIMLKVCEIAKKELTVVLSGDGGDELFWGYKRFQVSAQYFSFFQIKYFRRFVFIWERLKGNNIPAALMKYSSFSSYYLDKQGIPGNGKWIDKILKNSESIKAPYHYEKYLQNNEILTLEDGMALARQLEFDIHMQRVLLKVDRASMYHSLEVRTPLLSKKFVEYSHRYTYKECVNKNESKIPLRKALQSLIPKSENNSGNKKGFTPPLKIWLCSSLKDRIGNRILNIPEILKPYIDETYIQTIWNEHQTEKADHTWLIWSLYSLFVWVSEKMFVNAY
jgi:asparagine synthase (glutamine-hydrolysing)